MTKEFNSIARVSRFISNFGESMSMICDSYLVEHDLSFDADMVKEWASQRAYEYMPFISYIRLRGTFTNWGSRNVEQEKIDWADQKFGMIKVTRSTEYNHPYIVEFIKGWD